MAKRAFFIGVVAAVLSVMLLIFYLKEYEQRVAGGAQVEVLVANRAIVRGKPIAEDALGSRSIPAAYVDSRAVRVSDRDKLIGLKVTQTVPATQMLNWTDVIAEGDDQRDLGTLVQPGRRAMPVRIESADTVALTRPGDFVDVLGVLHDAKQSVVLLQRVLVLATGNSTSGARAGEIRLSTHHVLTLSVGLQEAQLLALASEKAKLTVVLRSPEDPRVTETPPDLLPAVLAEAPKRDAVRNAAKTTAVPTRLTAANETANGGMK